MKHPLTACAALLLGLAAPGHAQISLQSAVNLALKSSPRIKMAQADLDKARAARSEARDSYVPVISTSFGYGQSTGAPLNVPVIFSMTAQSLVFSFSQKDYIRSANASVSAAEHALHAIEIEVTEDAANTYLALDTGLERRQVLREQLGYADKLVGITNDRITLGVDPKVELPRSRRTATQIRLSALQVEDDVAASREHLAQLTGLPAASLTTERTSIPAFDAGTSNSPTQSDVQADSEGIRAAFDTARARQYVAFGDKRYLLRPQIGLGANYSRVATSLSSYGAYYPRYAGTPDHPNSENALSFGLQFSIPLLDMAHRAKARGSAADASRALAEAEFQRGTYREGRAKLGNAARELDLRAQLARDDREIAVDQLETIRLQMQASGSPDGPQVTPKDQLNAQLQERQKYLDVLAADLQLRQTRVNLLRQTEGLATWVLGNPGGRSLTPSVPPALGTNGAGSLGSSPGGVTPPLSPAIPSAPGR